MFTPSEQDGLLYAFLFILVPATWLFFRYAFTTRFWVNPAGLAFFAFISTSWLNYAISVASLQWPDWAASTIGVDVRIVSRVAIGLALTYSCYVFEKARRSGVRHDGFTGTSRRDEKEARRDDDDAAPAGR